MSRSGESFVTAHLTAALQARTILGTLALTMVGILQPTFAIGQTSRGANSNLQSAQDLTAQGTLAVAAEPTLPVCPSAGPAAPYPSPERTGHHKVILSWNASVPPVKSESKTVGYCVYRSKKENVARQSLAQPNSKCPECEQINSTAIAGTGCMDDPVEDSETYHYVVVAIDAQGNTSSGSDEVPAQIPPGQENTSFASASSYPRCRGTTSSK